MSLLHCGRCHWLEIRQALNGKGGPNVYLSLSRARALSLALESERQAQQTHDTAEEGARALCRHGIESRRRYSLVVCPLLHLAVLVAVCTLCVADELPTRSLLQFSSS